VRRIHFLVEGQTEEVVVREVLAPHLAGPNTWVTFSILASRRLPSGAKARGGVSKWSRIRRDLQELLRDTSIDVLTTMLDYYGMPSGAPGMATRPAGEARERVCHVEHAMAEAVQSPRFRPHLTLHETETWYSLPVARWETTSAIRASASALPRSSVYAEALR
jgi:Domain of unknown function (DUF4276)